MSAIAPDFLTVPEVAEQLRVNRWTVYRKVAAREIPGLRLGSAKNAPIRILARDVADYIHENTFGTSDQIAAELDRLRDDLRKAAP